MRVGSRGGYPFTSMGCRFRPHPRLSLIVATSLLAGAGGCANPGPPRPPSLQLPAVVRDLQAERVGSEVLLHWTTPSTTTDGVAMKGQITAQLCRASVSPLTPPAAGAGCVVVARQIVTAGASVATDRLPAQLATEPVAPLQYRVRLLNAAGHSAGDSGASFAAAGQAPPPVEELQAAPSSGGVRITWKPSLQPEAAVELTRTDLSAPVRSHQSGPSQPLLRLPRGRASTGAPSPLNTHLLAAPQEAADPGGALDRSATAGRQYSYVAMRVRTVALAGRALTLRSVSSPEVSLLVQDVAAPQIPAELQAVTDRGAVELSWSPDLEADLAGYIVYRASLAGAAAPLQAAPPGPPWVRLTARPVPNPTFEDRPGVTGRFVYRISAVDTSGNESRASAPASAELHSTGPD